VHKKKQGRRVNKKGTNHILPPTWGEKGQQGPAEAPSPLQKKPAPATEKKVRLPEEYNHLGGGKQRRERNINNFIGIQTALTRDPAKGEGARTSITLGRAQN